MVGTYFKMLGWATSIDKENDFSCSLKALDIVKDLSGIKLLRVNFSNTDERRFEICRGIKSILESGGLSRGEGQTIRGSLLFAESQIHGRRSVRHMQSLQGKFVLLRRKLKRRLCEKLETGRSRCISPLATDIVHLL